MMNVVLGFSKVKDFPFITILHTTHLLFANFVIPCVVCSPNLDEMRMCFIFIGCIGLFMIFVVSTIFLILSLFLSSSSFSNYHFGEYFWIVFVICWDIFKGFFVAMFFGVRSSFNGIFSVNWNLLFMGMVGYLLW